MIFIRLLWEVDMGTSEGMDVCLPFTMEWGVLFGKKNFSAFKKSFGCFSHHAYFLALNLNPCHVVRKVRKSFNSCEAWVCDESNRSEAIHHLFSKQTFMDSLLCTHHIPPALAAVLRADRGRSNVLGGAFRVDPVLRADAVWLAGHW